MKVTALTVLALLFATSAQATEKQSQSFLKKAIQGKYAEIEMEKLAQQNGQSELGVTPPDSPNAQHKADY